MSDSHIEAIGGGTNSSSCLNDGSGKRAKGKKPSSAAEKYAVCIALLPVIMYYEVPGVGLGLSTVLVIVSLIYAFWYLAKNFLSVNVLLAFVMALYFCYTSSSGGLSEKCIAIAIVVHALAISLGAADSKRLFGTVVLIAKIAAICVAIQYLVHVVIGIHIPFILSSFCLDDIRMTYASMIESGISSVEGGYRPSAFFLEPSHVAQYCCAALAICLLRAGKERYFDAAIISLGCLFTTSSMGIGVVAIIWALHFLFVSERGSLERRIPKIIAATMVAVLIGVILSQVPFFQYAMSRIVGSWDFDNGYNAFYGRFFYWDDYIAPMSGKDLIWGYGASYVPDVYFTGVMKIIYCHGCVGIFLFCLLILFIFVHNRCFASRAYTVLFGVLMIVGNMTGFISMIFFLGVVLCFDESGVIHVDIDSRKRRHLLHRRQTITS